MRVQQLIQSVLLSCMGLVAMHIMALQFPLPAPGENMIGANQTYIMQPDEDFYAIARRNDLALDDIKAANQAMPADMTAIDHAIVLPGRYVLPNVPHRGIIVNSATKRLYYFPAHQSIVYTFPVGIGKAGWMTPVGTYKIDEKIKNPIWIVPDSIMKYRQERGDPVPKIVRPGPADPLGKFAMRLSSHRYLIHSTNEPDGVGQHSSAGCIRMYPEDIKFLFPLVPVGTPVRIIDQPYKIGVSDGQLWLQAYTPTQSQSSSPTQPVPQDTAAAVMDPMAAPPVNDGSFIVPILQTYVKQHHLQVQQWNLDAAKQVAQDQTGIPRAVATLVG